MNINAIHLDHNILQKYYVPNDVNTTCIYLDGIIPINEYCVKLKKSQKYDTLIISNKHNHSHYYDVIIGFNIESKSTSKGFLCINHFVISSFFISNNKNHYPYLILLGLNDVILIAKRDVTLRVDVMAVDGSKFGMVKMYAEYAHKYIKVNNFGPIITYHNSAMCGHINMCTFYGNNDDNEIIYVINGVDDTKRSVNKTVKITKVNEICKRITQLLLFDDNMINIDVLMYISAIMYQIV